MDLRTYNSTRYQAIADLMGAQALYENSDINQRHRFITHTTPIKHFKNTPVKDRISYYNRANIRWAALFGQIEYTKNRFSTFIQGALSNQAYKRTDPFRYPRHSSLYETPRHNRWGGNLKGGFNININAQHNIFFNTGYYNRQPYFRALFPKNDQFYDNNMKNETVSSIEIGYGFQSEKLEMRLNAYHTLWANRFLSLTNQNFKLNEQTTITGTVDLKNIKQLHQGMELEMSYRPFSKLRINGQFSYGNWRYKDNVTASYFDETNRLVIEPISRQPFTNSIPLKNHLIGGSAQLTGSLGFALYLTKSLTFDGTWYYFDRMYGGINLGEFIGKDHKPLKLPGYDLLDLGLSLQIFPKQLKNIRIRINVNNVLDKRYIAESSTNIPVSPETKDTWKGIDTRNHVYFGFGRTWSAGLTFNF